MFLNYVTPTNIAFFFIAIFAIVMLCWNIKLERRIKKVFKTEKHQSIDDVISAIITQTTSLEKGHDTHREAIDILDARLQSMARTGVLKRFNAWGDTGGNQSFAIAFINEQGDGILLSSLYARERMSLFAKPISDWKSEYELSDEEQEVLTSHPNYKK